MCDISAYGKTHFIYFKKKDLPSQSAETQAFILHNKLSLAGAER